MHQEMADYSVQPPNGPQVYEGTPSTGVPDANSRETGMATHSQQAESFPMSTATTTTTTGSQHGDNYSSPSPSPPSGTATQNPGRQRSRSQMTMQQLNKKRQRASPEQLSVLEEAFAVNPSPNAKMREMIAERIQMTERSVQIWFQNRRAKVKQMQRKEVSDDGAAFYPGMTSPGMMDPLKRTALMRSNSLGHGPGYSTLPAEIKLAMRMGTFANGALTPAASPSNKAIISRLSIETLSIGDWHRVACSSMDLICYFSPIDGCFTYYINNSSTGFKIEYSLVYIRSVKIEHMIRKKESVMGGREEDRHTAKIMIELTQPPLFYSQHPASGAWQLCHDFTAGLVASTVLVHMLVGPYEALHAQFAELAALSPDLAARLWMDEQPQFLPVGEDEHSTILSGDRNRRHSSAMPMVAPPRPTSAMPAQFARQHLTPVPAFNANLGGPRVRQAFQAHRRTRSRSLPNAVNVSELALAASQHQVGSNMVPGMKFGHDATQYVPLGHDVLYQPQTPLRIDTSVADSTMDYYRQFTPASNISAQLTPVDYTTSPASAVPLPSALPFYEGNEYHPVSATAYAQTTIYSTEGIETPTMYSEAQTPLMNLESYQPQDTYTYASDHASMQGVVDQQAWTAQTPQVTVSSQMDVDPKDVQGIVVKGQEVGEVKMDITE